MGSGGAPVIAADTGSAADNTMLDVTPTVVANIEQLTLSIISRLDELKCFNDPSLEAAARKAVSRLLQLS